MNLPVSLPSIGPAYSSSSYDYAIACVNFQGWYSANWLGMHRCLRNRIAILSTLHDECEQEDILFLSVPMAEEIKEIQAICKATISATVNSQGGCTYLQLRRQVIEELQRLRDMSGTSIVFARKALAEFRLQRQLPAPATMLALPHYPTHV